MNIELDSAATKEFINRSNLRLSDAETDSEVIARVFNQKSATTGPSKAWRPSGCLRTDGVSLSVVYERVAGDGGEGVLGAREGTPPVGGGSTGDCRG